MRTILFTILLAICTSYLQAQSFELLKGKNYLDDRHILFAANRGEEIIALLSDEEGSTLSYSSNLYVEKLDKTFAVQSSKSAEQKSEHMLPAVNSDLTTIYHFDNINGELYLYYSKRDINRNRVELLVMKINLDHPEKSTETTLKTIKMEDSNNSLTFQINNEKSLVSFFYIKSESESDICFLAASVFQTITHEEKWAEDFNTKKNKNQFRFYDQVLSDDGTLLVGIKMYRKSNEKDNYVNQLGDDTRGYDIGLMQFEEANVEYKELKTYQNYVREYHLRIRSNKLIACGTYQRYYGGNITGVYCVEIDLGTDEVISNRWIPYGKALLEDLKKEDVAEVKRIDSGIKVKSGTGKIAFAQNNRLYYIFEPAKFARFGAGYSSPDYFYARSIIVTELNNESMHYLIPRYNQSPLTSGNSTSIIESKGELRILYLDHKDNITRNKKLKKSKTFETKVLAMATIDSKNNISREAIIDLKKERFICIPPGLLNLSDNSFLIDGQSYDYRGFDSTFPQRNAILKIK